MVFHAMETPTKIARNAITTLVFQHAMMDVSIKAGGDGCASRQKKMYNLK